MVFTEPYSDQYVKLTDKLLDFTDNVLNFVSCHFILPETAPNRNQTLKSDRHDY